MNTKHLLITFILFSILLAACGGAATRAPVAEEPEEAAPIVEVTRVVEAEAAVGGEGETPVAQAPLATPAPTYPAVAPASTASALPTSAPGIAPTVPPPFNNYFEDYGVNPFVDTIEDHLSTFALDVDTASYTVARRYVMDGNLPPADAIRVEEFVNYFDQGYSPPPDVAFSVYADGAPAPFYYDGTHLLRFGVQGYEVSESERKPLSLTFVIDVSGSMDLENRLELVKQSLSMLVDRLRPTDTVGIVVYGSNARIVLNPTSGEDRNSIQNAIYGLRTEGATNAEAGLRLGYQIANLAYRPGAVNRVILASDGVANVGVTDPDELNQFIRGYADAGITLTTIGFGMGNFNDVLLEQLADNGDGNYAYVDTLAEAERLFVDNLTSTLQTIALDAKVQVDFNPDVVARYRLLGYENRAIADTDFRNDAVDAGEFGAGHTAAAIYAVQFWPEVAGRIATVQLRWEDPETHKVTEINGNFNTWELMTSYEAASPRFQLAMLTAQYAEVLRGSPWASDISLGELSARAERVSAQLDDADVSEFANLVNRAWQIRGW